MSTELTATEVLPPSAIESITRGEIDVQISTAKRFPRSIGQVKKDMLSFATLDQETAESCFYSLPRGGKTIQGPSVRLAEIAVSCYGNLRAGVRVLETVSNGDSPHVVLQAVCHDLEKNTCVTIEKRRRITKKKNKDAPDEDDINLACNAGSAIAFRDCVFKVVPGALIKPVYEQAKAVAIGDAKTLSERRERAIAAFGKMGVKLDKILASLSKKSLEEIDLADLETLFGLHTAIKDGHTTIDEAFPSVTPTAEKSKLFKDKSPKPEDCPQPPPYKSLATSETADSPSTTHRDGCSSVTQNESAAFSLDGSEVPLVEQVTAKLAAASLKWSEVHAVMVDNGLADPEFVPLDECLSDVLTACLAKFDDIVNIVKGVKP
jgi:hypothetical protein